MRTTKIDKTWNPITGNRGHDLSGLGVSIIQNIQNAKNIGTVQDFFDSDIV